jgi:hypothetical protein
VKEQMKKNEVFWAYQIDRQQARNKVAGYAQNIIHAGGPLLFQKYEI